MNVDENCLFRCQVYSYWSNIFQNAHIVRVTELRAADEIPYMPFMDLTAAK